MKRVAEFLRHAEECLSIAARASNAKIRSELEELAHGWIQLAGEREKFLRSAGDRRDRD